MPGSRRGRRSTSERSAAGAGEVLALVARNVHKAFIHHDVDRICRAFHLDGRHAWRLDGAESRPIRRPGHDQSGSQPLLASISAPVADETTATTTA